MDKSKDNQSNKEEEGHTLYRNTRDDKDYVQYMRVSYRVKAEARKAVRGFQKLITTKVKTTQRESSNMPCQN